MSTPQNEKLIVKNVRNELLDNTLHNKTQNSNKNYSGKEKLMRDTFYLTYVLLLTTGTICFIEALRTKDIKVRNILNLEVCISVIAAYFYAQFVKKVENVNVDYRKINITRYTDWFITTPIMLLVLVLALVYNTGDQLQLSKFIVILLLNFGMLTYGYRGEMGKMKKEIAVIIGFVFFFALYGYIYFQFMHQKYHFDNMLIFVAFLVFWSLYGVLYLLNKKYEKEKNVGYNVLDLFSKCFVGIFFWAYFTKVFVLN